MDNTNIVGTKETLSEIKFKLVIEKLSGTTISRDKLRSIVEKAKENLDKKVKATIDEVFDEYLGVKKLSPDTTLSINDMQKIYTDSLGEKEAPPVLSLKLDGEEKMAA